MRITSANAVFTMSPENSPVAKVKSGSTVIFETKDCFGNQITSEDQIVSAIDWDKINPATGPLYIEEAKPGDVLRVEILDIVLADCGTMIALPGEGILTNVITKEKTWRIPVADKKVRIHSDIYCDISPMIGVIGTAPITSVATGTPGAHGGNMDNRRITKGSVLYLPVAVCGALLAIGDLHALMSDGEVLCCGLEIPGEVTVKVDVIKDEKYPTPFLMTTESAIAIASAETLDEAVTNATYNMHSFILERTNLDAQEVGKLLSLCGQLCVCQVVDPLKTARMEFPRKILEQLVK